MCVAEQESAVQRRYVGEGGWGREGGRRVAAEQGEAKRRGKVEEEREEDACSACVAAQESAVTRRLVWEGAWRIEGGWRDAAKLQTAKRQGKQAEEEEARRGACVEAQKGALERMRVWRGAAWRGEAADRQKTRLWGKQEEVKEQRGCAACVAEQESAVQRRRVGEEVEGWRRVVAERQEVRQRGKQEDEEEGRWKWEFKLPWCKAGILKSSR